MVAPRILVPLVRVRIPTSQPWYCRSVGQDAALSRRRFAGSSPVSTAKVSLFFKNRVEDRMLLCNLIAKRPIQIKSLKNKTNFDRVVVQLVRMPHLGCGCRRFESCLLDKNKNRTLIMQKCSLQHRRRSTIFFSSRKSFGVDIWVHSSVGQSATFALSRPRVRFPLDPQIWV